MRRIVTIALFALATPALARADDMSSGPNVQQVGAPQGVGSANAQQGKGQDRKPTVPREEKVPGGPDGKPVPPSADSGTGDGKDGAAQSAALNAQGVKPPIASCPQCIASGDKNLCCKPHCMVPPPPPCPKCKCACDNRLTCTLFSDAHAMKLIQELSTDNSCKRLCIVKKLGCRLHADICRCPAVLDALLRELQCDPCWSVRREAAWALMGQHALLEPAVLALYTSARLDPHYMVRVRAAEALDIITLGQQECFRELYKAADQLLVVLRAKGYQPGRDCCLITSATSCSPGGLAIAMTLPETPEEKKAKAKEKAEELPPPKETEEKVPVEKLPLPTPQQKPEKLPLPR